MRKVLVWAAAGLAGLGGLVFNHYGEKWLDRLDKWLASPSGQMFHGRTVDFVKVTVKAWGEHPVVAVLLVVLIVPIVLWGVPAARNVIRRRKSPSTTAELGEPTNELISEGWLEQVLEGAGYSPTEVRRDIQECLRALRRGGLATQSAVRRFLADERTRSDLATIYREELRRGPDQPLDPVGLCTWGPRLHLAPPADRAAVLASLREEIRTYYDRDAGREMTPDEQRRRAIEHLQPRDENHGPIFGVPQQAAAEDYLKWWHIPLSSPHLSLVDCSVFLLIDGRRIQLLWPTAMGPTERWTLRPGEDPRAVPVVIRSEIRVVAPAASGTLDASVARITGQSYFIGDMRNYVDVPVGLHAVSLLIAAGDRQWESKRYRIAVPEAHSNLNFSLDLLGDAPVNEPPAPVRSAGLEQRWLRQYEPFLPALSDLDELDRLLATLITQADWVAADSRAHLSWFAIATEELEQRCRQIESRLDDHTLGLLRECLEILHHLTSLFRLSHALPETAPTWDRSADFKAREGLAAFRAKRDDVVAHFRDLRSRHVRRA